MKNDYVVVHAFEPYPTSGNGISFRRLGRETGMALFKLDASCEFHADSIDDAFLKLAKHFSALASSEDSDLIVTGEINIEPIRSY